MFAGICVHCVCVCVCVCMCVCVCDLQLVLRELSPKEIACVQCRVGMLRLWNPFKPDGAVQLVLSRYEERRVSKKITVAFICQGDSYQHSDCQDIYWTGIE
jgi:hypothetical protein